MKNRNTGKLYDRKLKSKIITVSGGKGGIGKTFFSVNFAVELKKRGYKILIFDGDINLSNVNLHMNIDDNNSFSKFVSNKIPIEEVIRNGVGGVDVLYAGDDIKKVINIDTPEFMTIARGLTSIESAYDFIIVDTQAGLNDFNLKLIHNSDRRIMITNPDITALVDLYKVIKVAAAKKPGISFEIILNKAPDAETAIAVFKKISDTASRFKVRTKISLLGYIIDDPRRVLESIQKRIPIVLLHETGNVRGCITNIVNTFLKGSKPKADRSFFHTLISK